ncbi:MAG: hypothetical protein IIX69_01375 [Clostridia bacterium]|nr:hypothetical protein [Clostridia bacterium]MBQ1933364.1 hypothetical protein [Clostridia bacterium]
MEKLLEMLVELAVSGAALLMAYFVIPWLKEKRLLSVVRKAVEAAEKLSENQSLDKKEYVHRVLERAGIKIDELVEAMIEGCVLELDLMISNIKDPAIDDAEDYD